MTSQDHAIQDICGRLREELAHRPRRRVRISALIATIRLLKRNRASA